jgi:hypothetical protein
LAVETTVLSWEIFTTSIPALKPIFARRMAAHIIAHI